MRILTCHPFPDKAVCLEANVVNEHMIITARCFSTRQLAGIAPVENVASALRGEMRARPDAPTKLAGNRIIVKAFAQIYA